jgi:hypothetical protein
LCAITSSELVRWSETTFQGMLSAGSIWPEIPCSGEAGRAGERARSLMSSFRIGSSSSTAAWSRGILRNSGFGTSSFTSTSFSIWSIA